MFLESVRHEVAAVIMAQRQAAGGAGVDAAELISHRHADGLKSFEAGPALGDMPTEQLGVPATPNSQTLPSWTVAIWVASVAHITFGASVTIRRSCGASERFRARWPGFRSEAQRAKRSGFERLFQARQARLGMAS